MTTFLLNLFEGFNGDQRKYMELQLFLEINLRGGEWDPKFMDLQWKTNGSQKSNF